VKRIAICVSFLAVLMTASIANAQATRTWVSGVGNDANPCSLTAPCKTWAGAFSKTAAGGEMDSLDSGGFGSLTINKAITVDGGPGNVAGTVTAAASGFVITAAATDRVLIRNVKIDGVGGGTVGIKVNSAKSVTIQNVDIFNMSAGLARGIDVQCNSACRVTVRDTRVDDNGGIGMVFGGTIANVVVADVYNSETSNNASHGMFVNQGAKVTLSSHVSSNNAITGLIVDGTGTTVSAFNSTFANNISGGVQSGLGAATTATVGLSKCVVSGNSPGVQISGGVVQTHNDNSILRNNVDVAGGALSGVSQQ
jgi:hypothetical protein